jgi:hypothetical protein
MTAEEILRNGLAQIIYCTDLDQAKGYAQKYLDLATAAKGELKPAVLPEEKEEAEAIFKKEAEGRYPVETHSTPHDSPYSGVQRTFLYGCQFGYSVAKGQLSTPKGEVLPEGWKEIVESAFEEGWDLCASGDYPLQNRDNLFNKWLQSQPAPVSDAVALLNFCLEKDYYLEDGKFWENAFDNGTPYTPEQVVELFKSQTK